MDSTVEFINNLSDQDQMFIVNWQYLEKNLIPKPVELQLRLSNEEQPTVWLVVAVWPNGDSESASGATPNQAMQRFLHIDLLNPTQKGSSNAQRE